MKKAFVWILMTVFLFGCGKKNAKADISGAYSGNISCTVTIEALSEPAAEYIISFERKDGMDTVEIIKPESIKGIKATVEKGTAAIEYDGSYLETLLPAYWGVSPVDALSALFDDLSRSLPFRTDNADDLTVEYKQSGDEAEIYRRAVLDKKTLALKSAEIEADGEVLLIITCDSINTY